MQKLLVNYTKLCSVILGLEPQIRGVYVYHINGEFLAGGMRDGVQSYLPPDEMSKSLHDTILRWKTRERIYPFLGLGKYSFTEYQKIKRITFPIGSKSILVVGMEPQVDHDAIIQKILQFIKDDTF